MANPASGRQRATVSFTVDPALLHAIDRYVQRHPHTNRSEVVESALKSWDIARQKEEMIEQFSGADPAASDQHKWQRIRRAAVRRNLMRPAR